MRSVATTLLDVLGLLLLAAGAGFLAAGEPRLAAVGVSGIVVLAGSAAATALANRPARGTPGEPR